MNDNILQQVNFAGDPLKQFEKWYQVAITHPRIIEANAMSLATVSAHQQPAIRIVLLKYFDIRGFVFFTNYQSRKAREIAENPAVALLFWWAPLNWQVRIEGHAVRRTWARFGGIDLTPSGSVPLPEIAQLSALRIDSAV